MSIEKIKKIAVLRNTENEIIGIMKGDYALSEGWIEEDDIGQQIKTVIDTSTKKRILTLKQVESNKAIDYEVISDEIIFEAI